MNDSAYYAHPHCAPDCPSHEGAGVCARLRASGVGSLFQAPEPPCRPALVRRLSAHAREVARAAPGLDEEDVAQAMQLHLLTVELKVPALAAVIALARLSARHVARGHGLRVETPRCSSCVGLARTYDAAGERRCDEPASPAYERVVVILRGENPATCEARSEKRSRRVDRCRWVRKTADGWACTNARCPYAGAASPPRMERTARELGCDRFRDRRVTRAATLPLADWRADAPPLGRVGRTLRGILDVVEARAMIREAIVGDPRAVVRRWLPDASEDERREIARVLRDVVAAIVEGSDE